MNTLKNLKDEYREWLRALGFASSSVKSLPNYIEEMLIYLEEMGLKDPREITEDIIRTYFFQWKNRKNKTSGAGLSIAHINKKIVAINNFIKFLHRTGKNPKLFKLLQERVPTKKPEILTKEEIQKLYEATYHQKKRIHSLPFEQRDRAMLAVFYGCGLRRSEGNSLLVKDFLLEKQLLHVRQGKGNNERYVPISEGGLKEIQEYLSYGRKWFIQKQNNLTTERFFLNIWGEPMKDFTTSIRNLKKRAGIDKKISLHTFRHSIATHLMQSGMAIETIAQFLGHRSLDSTQIYTHLTHEAESEGGFK